MNRVLVTGASGFVGAWLLRALRADGCDVVAMAPQRPAEALPGVTWATGDLRDDAYVASTVVAAGADTVFHLAAVSHVPTAAADPAAAWDLNVTATARLLHHLATRAGATLRRVLVIGSGEQYGRHDPAAGPLREDAPQAPRTVYAATKAAQEVCALQAWRAAALPVVVARSFNHSGPGQDPRFLLPALVRRALALRHAPPGTPLPLGNRSPVRDFLHVRDVVAAYISLGRAGVPGEAYNVASGTGWAVEDVVARVLARAGVQAVPTEDPALVRPVDIPWLVGDAGKLGAATGWRPAHALDDIIDDLLHAEAH
ncbi:MAG: GDP-mannose 4,6-dehydratase [Gemmatimonadetes bacterium]|nr:GDP-mannose 4,6-dehydratase [Gemmatimonadota bacterium]